MEKKKKKENNKIMDKYCFRIDMNQQTDRYKLCIITRTDRRVERQRTDRQSERDTDSI